MSNRIDLLKGLIVQNDIKSSSKRRNKRQASKILIQIKKIFNEVLREADDMVFQEDIMRLLSSSVANLSLIHILRPEEESARFSVLPEGKQRIPGRLNQRRRRSLPGSPGVQ